MHTGPVSVVLQLQGHRIGDPCRPMGQVALQGLCFTAKPFSERWLQNCRNSNITHHLIISVHSSSVTSGHQTLQIYPSFVMHKMPQKAIVTNAVLSHTPFRPMHTTTRQETLLQCWRSRCGRSGLSSTYSWWGSTPTQTAYFMEMCQPVSNVSDHSCLHSQPAVIWLSREPI